MPCKNTFGAVWEAGFNGIALPSPPLNLRVTNKLKQQVSSVGCLACLDRALAQGLASVVELSSVVGYLSCLVG